MKRAVPMTNPRNRSHSSRVVGGQVRLVLLGALLHHRPVILPNREHGGHFRWKSLPVLKRTAQAGRDLPDGDGIFLGNNDFKSGAGIVMLS